MKKLSLIIISILEVFILSLIIQYSFFLFILFIFIVSILNMFLLTNEKYFQTLDKINIKSKIQKRKLKIKKLIH